MRWTREGANLLLQLRIKTLNNELKDEFIKWYPGMKNDNYGNDVLAACPPLVSDALQNARIPRVPQEPFLFIMLLTSVRIA
jgi:hypothetical protein